MKIQCAEPEAVNQSSFFPHLGLTDLARRHRADKRCRSMALVITLAIMLLITIMVVAFISTVSLDRQATANYARAEQADSIALGGLDQVISQIRSEITDAANSTANGGGSVTIYTPVTNSTSIPQRNSSLPTIVGYSGVKLYSDATNLATTSFSTNASANSRLVSMTEWYRPQLTTTTNGFPTPQWVLIARGGSFPTSWNKELADKSLTNPLFVLGRYAYVVYDTSGLIDANVAGYSSSAAANSTNRGVLPWVDLTQLPGVTQTDVDNLVKWRNAASVTNYASYVTNYETNGFMQVAPGDTTFVGRQDLIKYAQTVNPDLANALPYLTTFSRELNGPTWGPTTNMGVVNGTNYNYQVNATTSGSFNPLIYNPRVQQTFTRNNGIQSVVGEPLVKYRFPLSKLALLEKMQGLGTLSSDEIDQVQKYFGLDLASDVTASTGFYRHWIYPTANTKYPHGVGSGASGIMSLDDVASVNREPDFFELLQAGILQGSLGVYNKYQSNSAYKAHARWDFMMANPIDLAQLPFTDTDTSKTLQLLRIGANIIDQWHADNFPTTITYQPAGTPLAQCLSVFGICDLPYFNAMFINVYNQPQNMGVGSSQGPCVYMVPQIWNPHQAPATAYANTPTVFKIVPDSGDVWTLNYYAPGVNGSPNGQNGAVIGLKSYNGASSVFVNGAGAPRGTTQTFPGITTTNNIQFPAGIADYRDPSPVTNAISGNAAGLWAPTHTSTTNWPTGAIQINLPLPPSSYGMATEAPAFPPATVTNAVPTHTSPPANELIWAQATNSVNYASWGVAGYPTYSAEFNWSGVFILEYLNPNNNTWVPYSTFVGVPNVNPGTVSGIVSETGNFAYPINTNNIPLPYGANLTKSDPRTYRFGPGLVNFTDLYTPTGFDVPRADPYLSLNPTTTLIANRNISDAPFINGLGSPVVQNPYRLDMWAVNDTSIAKHAIAPTVVGGANADNSTVANSETYDYYTDPDGTYRYGDTRYAYNTTAGYATPYLTGAQQNRPVVLHRAFTSVGDLGYAFRDDPWRTLDFSSPTSADAALLDLFSVTDGQSVTQPNGQQVAVTAGKVNPNTPYSPVLAALMAGASQNRYPTGTLNLSTNNAQALATAFVSATTAQPILNRSELATRLMTNSALATAGIYLKGDRESVVRSLAEAANTRTWNFLVDIVGQSGIYPPSATSLDNFTVTGERHYWLHVAIDRYTGQVIDKRLEIVDQ